MLVVVLGDLVDLVVVGGEGGDNALLVGGGGVGEGEDGLADEVSDIDIIDVSGVPLVHPEGREDAAGVRGLLVVRRVAGVADEAKGDTNVVYVFVRQLRLVLGQEGVQVGLDGAKSLQAVRVAALEAKGAHVAFLDVAADGGVAGGHGQRNGHKGLWWFVILLNINNFFQFLY